MQISKSLFKNLTRCGNFVSLYDMYCFKNAHHVKTINGIDVAKINQDMDKFAEGFFLEENENALDIFNHMFDEETGEDLTLVTNAQMDALADSFKKVEKYACDYLKKHFKGEFIFSSITKEQKRFSFNHHGNNYYCYLDIYNEEEDVIRIFEVKSTTMSKFYALGTEVNKNASLKKDRYDSIFIKGNDSIMYLREDLLTDVTTSKLKMKSYHDYRSKLFNRYESCGKYVYDLAIERYFIENSLIENKEQHKIPKIKYYLVVLNCDYEFNGEYINNEPNYVTDHQGNELYSVIDLTNITKEIQETIKKEIEKIEFWNNELTISLDRFGKNCELKKSTECKFKSICYSKTCIKGSIMEYTHKNNAFKDPELNEKLEVYDFLNHGEYHMLDVPRTFLPNQNNRIQYDCQLENKTFIDKAKIKLGIDQITYPIYHLDFETFGCPLPRYYKEHPYSQSVFQFSLHIEKEKGICDKNIDHEEFLAPDHSDHRRELCEHMIKLIDLSNGGIVMVYNESFEKTRLKELANIYPDLSADLLNIREHVFDLLFILTSNCKMYEPLLSEELNKKEKEQLAKRYNYYNNKQIGSFSIKKILPIFTNLSYQDLIVHNGSDAVMRYSELENYTPDEYQKYYLALREYCKQDTWAMVEILRGLRTLVNK